MRKINYLLFAMLSMVILSCSSGDDPESNTEGYGIYKVVLEPTGEEYSAQAHIYNTSNVNLYDETAGKDTGTHSIMETFHGRQEYSTVKEVENIAIQGILTSRNPASLKMTVYKNEEIVFQKSVSLKENNGGHDGTVDIVYSTIQE